MHPRPYFLDTRPFTARHLRSRDFFVLQMEVGEEQEKKRAGEKLPRALRCCRKNFRQRGETFRMRSSHCIIRVMGEAGGKPSQGSERISTHAYASPAVSDRPDGDARQGDILRLRGIPQR